MWPATVPAALVAAMLAGLCGWWLAGKVTDSPAPPPVTAPSTVRAGPVTATVDPGWRAVSGPVPVPGVPRAGSAVLAPRDGRAGRMVLALVEPGGPSLLPAATAVALRQPLPHPRTTKLAGRPALAYDAVALQGAPGLTDLVVAPGTAGVVLVACTSSVAEPLPSDACPGGLTALAVPGSAVAPGPDAALAGAAPGVLADVDRVRRDSRAALRTAATPAGQAAAASRLAAADRRAARALAPLAPGAALVAALRECGSAYAGLAGAAERRDGAAWTRARAAVDAAESRLRTSVAALAPPTR